MSDEYITWQPGKLPEWLRDRKDKVDELEFFRFEKWSGGSYGRNWRTNSYRMKREDYERLCPRDEYIEPLVECESADMGKPLFTVYKKDDRYKIGFFADGPEDKDVQNVAMYFYRAVRRSMEHGKRYFDEHLFEQLGGLQGEHGSSDSEST